MSTMNAEDYDAACSLVLESFETLGMSVARIQASYLMGVDHVSAHTFQSMLNSGHRMRDEFLRQHDWTTDVGCWAEPGSTGINKHRWASRQAEIEQRRRLRATPK